MCLVSGDRLAMSAGGPARRTRLFRFRDFTEEGLLMTESTIPEAGKAAPAFTLPAYPEGTIKLSQFKGEKNVVLYFYPKDDTPGCTTEACDFRDNLARIQSADTVVLGISPDDVKSHGKFAAKFELPFALLSDVDHAVCEKYGVWVEKSMYGRKYMGVQRATFLIGKNGNLDDRTLVFFTSDNGPWFGGSTGGLRGMKSQWWEGGIRVPLIARLPGVIPAGHVSAEPAIIMDLFVTSLTAAKLKVPDDRTLDGRDIMPLLTSGAKSPHAGLLSFQSGIRTVRAGDWKLHLDRTPPPGIDDWGDDWKDPRLPNGTTIIAPPEQYLPSAHPGLKTGDRSTGPALFNLVDDPAEQHNVAADHPAIVARLKSLAGRLSE